MGQPATTWLARMGARSAAETRAVRVVAVRAGKVCAREGSAGGRCAARWVDVAVER